MQDERSTNEVVKPELRRPFDDLENLYVGHFGEVGGRIGTSDGQFSEALFGGELLLYGHFIEEEFVVDRLRRMALRGRRVEYSAEDPIGTLSLTGPLSQAAIDPGSGNIVDTLHLQLHYRALSTELPPACQTEDALFPEVEELLAHLNWEQLEKTSESIVQLKVELLTVGLLEPKLGLVREVTLPPFVMDMQLVGSDSGETGPHSLRSGGSPPPSPANPGGLNNCASPIMFGPAWLATVERRLPVKFVNLTQDYTGNLVTLCNEQISGVCDVWRDKAALDLTIWPNAEDPSSSSGPALLDPGEIAEATVDEKTNNHIIASSLLETNLLGIQESESTASEWGHVEVYLVDLLADRLSGGVAHFCGTTDAFCILQADKAEANMYLLAHELGHVLGLDHPEGGSGGSCAGLPFGSYGSILVATGGAGPNPEANTLYNCRIFGMPIECCEPVASGATCDTFTHNSIVKTTADTGYYFHPDPVDHFIGDFPGDDGTEPSVPPLGENRWSNSSVWNRRADDNDATHEEPHCSDDHNYMHVKLEYRTDVRDPVCVDFFLADPGVSPGHEHLTPLRPPPNHRLYFAEPPAPGSPVAASLEWSWADDVPAGYPTQCCVFALAHSVDEPLPFIPTDVTFWDVFSLLGTSNDIAQRNLHVHECTPSGSTPFFSTFPWLVMANPFPEPAAAELKIDASQALGLECLSLEMDGKPIQDIAIGESVWVNIADSLGPRDRRILRLQVSLPPDVPLGSAFPIDLLFLVNGEPITGYRHLLRVAPLKDTVLQVLDQLHGALRAVHAGCGVDTKPLLAEIAQFNTQSHEDIADALPGFGAQIASPVSEVASEIAGRGQECQAVHQHVSQLANLLLAADDEAHPVWEGDFSPSLLAERIRDLADRIQEPAARLAR